MSVINRFDNRADADLERVAYAVGTATATRSARVYGVFNYCFSCSAPVGFMDLATALGEHAPEDVIALAPHLMRPDMSASTAFRERLVDMGIPTFYTPTVTNAFIERSAITRTVHEHNFARGHYAETPERAPAYFWTDDARYAGVAPDDVQFHAKIATEKREVLEGFLNPQTVSDALRAVPRVVQYDTDLLLVDPSTGYPLAWVEHCKTTKGTNPTLNISVELSRLMSTPLVHVLWESPRVTTTYVSNGVWTARDITPASSLPSTPSAFVTNVLTDWITHRVPRGSLIKR